MTETRWIPGPWSIDTDGSSSIDIIAKAKDPETGEEYDAVVAEWVAHGDATLIVAGPEMYEALDVCVSVLGGCANELEAQGVGTRAVIEAIAMGRAALKKARGEA